MTKGSATASERQHGMRRPVQPPAGRAAGCTAAMVTAVDEAERRRAGSRNSA